MKSNGSFVFGSVAIGVGVVLENVEKHCWALWWRILVAGLLEVGSSRVCGGVRGLMIGRAVVLRSVGLGGAGGFCWLVMAVLRCPEGFWLGF